MPGVPGKPLPTGIECRTPSPEPKLNHDWKNEFSDAYSSYDSKLYALSSLGLGAREAYDFERAVDLREQQDLYLHNVKLCDIAIRKLWKAHFAWGGPFSCEQAAGIQAFRRRNTLLAVLEPALVDKGRLCTMYLQIYAATFLDCPKLSLFSRQYILPALEHNGTDGEAVALARGVDDFIQMGINALSLSAHTLSLIESSAALDQNNMLVSDVFPSHYEDAINPALLNGSLGIREPTLTFDTFGLDMSDSPRVDSSGSSPATTTFSASDYEMSPSMLFGGSSPATEATVPDVNMPLVHSQAGNLETRLLSELNLSVFSYQSGNSTLAISGLKNVATSGNSSTARGDVLTRLARFCLSCIHRKEGTIEEAENCLMEAVRGSTHFQNDEGEEWHEVSHLFL